MEKQKNSRSHGKAASQAQGDKCSKLAVKGKRCFHLMSSGFGGDKAGHQPVGLTDVLFTLWLEAGE